MNRFHVHAHVDDCPGRPSVHARMFATDPACLEGGSACSAASATVVAETIAEPVACRPPTKRARPIGIPVVAAKRDSRGEP